MIELWNILLLIVVLIAVFWPKGVLSVKPTKEEQK